MQVNELVRSMLWPSPGHLCTTGTQQQSGRRRVMVTALVRADYVIPLMHRHVLIHTFLYAIGDAGNLW